MSRRRKRNYQRNHPCWIVKLIDRTWSLRRRGYPFQRPFRSAYRRGRRRAF